jgi:hypothetical protein
MLFMLQLFKEDKTKVILKYKREQDSLYKVMILVLSQSSL